MTDSRCHRCDRAECPAWTAPDPQTDAELFALGDAERDCDRHAISPEQWRTRALAAEAERDRLRAAIASLADQWQRESDSETSCRLGTGRRAGLLSCRRDLRAALATAEGKESDRG